MPESEDVAVRRAIPTDAQAIAALHAESWRHHYRGAYSDDYLDGDVIADRLAVWTARLDHPTPTFRTLVAQNGRDFVGFAHAVLDDDPTWGALLDNLHVTFALKRRGIGTRLIAATAQAVIDAAPSSGLYLWVLEKNTPAQRFYESRGGQRADISPVPAPGGDPTRLMGQPNGVRYTWPDPRTLLTHK